MAILSVRDIANRHLGKTGDLSLNSDLYGYIHRDAEARLFGHLEEGDRLPGAPAFHAPTTRSLLRHLQTISGRSVDLVLFLVAHEHDFSGVVSRADVVKLQYAVQVARDIYAHADVGIRRLEWGYIPVALAGNFADITSAVEAVLLTTTFTGRPGAIDVFVVQTMGALAGRSPRPGSCNKNALIGMTGCVIELAQSTQFTGILIAHEVGHYLGLGHESDDTNMMCGPVPFRDHCDPSTNMTELTSRQGDTMRAHCMINPGD